MSLAGMAATVGQLLRRHGGDRRGGRGRFRAGGGVEEGRGCYLPVYPELERAQLGRMLALLGNRTRVEDAQRLRSAFVSRVLAPAGDAVLREAVLEASGRGEPLSLMGTLHNGGGHAFRDGVV